MGQIDLFFCLAGNNLGLITGNKLLVSLNCLSILENKEFIPNHILNSYLLLLGILRNQDIKDLSPSGLFGVKSLDWVSRLTSSSMKNLIGWARSVLLYDAVEKLLIESGITYEKEEHRVRS